MTDLSQWVPDNVDLTTPSAARIYDAMLGGAHNFEVDREFARKAELAFPGVGLACRANRAFLRRAVEFLAESGVRQFLDIGSGIPTVANVHEVAQRIAPESRVVYVDHDPVAVAHSQLILHANDHADVVRADVRDPESILNARQTRRLLDFDQPIALLMLALLHFVPDADDPAGLAARYRDVLAPGSYLVITHGSGDARPEDTRAALKLYASSSNPAASRSREWITGLFGDFELVAPGAVGIADWRRDTHLDVADQSNNIFFGGVARKP